MPPPVEPESVRIEREARRQAELLAREAVRESAVAEKRRWEQFTHVWDAAIEALRTEIDTQVVEMAIRIAEIVLQHRLPDAEMIRSVLKDVLEPISDLQGMRVRMSPTEMAAHGETLMVERQRAIEWVSDPSLRAGDVIVESRSGIFDGRLGERMARLSEALNDASGWSAGGMIPSSNGNADDADDA